VIYVFANDDRGLTAYPSVAQAVAACEGVDVESGNYRFFAQDGSPLRARFSSPALRASALVVSRPYTLEADNPAAAPHLRQVLAQVAYIEGGGLTQVEEVAALLEAAESGAART
jgi:hypothetical protein